MQGDLRKKQIIGSFVKHFPKLSQEGCFKPYVYYTSLGTGLSMKEGTSFVEHFKENHEYTTSVCFQFYILKFSQGRCLILSPLYGTV